ncbi:flagellar biosynthesis protein FlgD [Bombella sp. TMW 2.2543]|uniref:Basal-body rod modification protein FlgD n=1 Tax=Bombella pluederhausensis TaxID=2967336 RepID=A0ABT3WGA2_9PROT|nr:flagellar hook capping FlgD N-terminal domain-containing protein [Bombella pluederhausensis]MCX5618099.1 flagellar biosynthesis protein FlgD [Bombella pluederhausensis]
MANSLSTNILALQQATDSAARSGAASLGKAGQSGSSAGSTAGAFASMANNENNFLTLLTAQLKHQDPSSPMNTENMAAQLAQFSTVEQQVQTNSNLNTLISLNETAQLTQDKGLVGRQVSVSGTTLPLQSGSAGLSFQAGAGQTVGISVANSAGQVVRHDVLRAGTGQTSWTWDGKDDSGTSLSDGAYSVAVKTVDSQGNTSDVPFTIKGTVTGMKKSSTGMNVLMGDAEIPMSSVQATS